MNLGGGRYACAEAGGIGRHAACGVLDTAVAAATRKISPDAAAGLRLRLRGALGRCGRLASRVLAALPGRPGRCPTVLVRRYVVSPAAGRENPDSVTAKPAPTFNDAGAQPSRPRRARTVPTAPSARGACRTGRTWRSSARRCSPRRGPAPSPRPRAARWSARSPTS